LEDFMVSTVRMFVAAGVVSFALMTAESAGAGEVAADPTAKKSPVEPSKKELKKVDAEVRRLEKEATDAQKKLAAAREKQAAARQQSAPAGAPMTVQSLCAIAIERQEARKKAEKKGSDTASGEGRDELAEVCHRASLAARKPGVSQLDDGSYIFIPDPTVYGAKPKIEPSVSDLGTVPP
jgi:Skp family chaperone for outer membrane proteins